MNIDNTLTKYFTHQSLVKISTEYVLYYQISLGAIAFETIGDPEETVTKLKDLKLTIEPNDILENLLYVIDTIVNVDNLEKTLKTRAMLHALKDFVEADDELLNKERFLQLKIKDIEDNLFFNSKMKMQFLSEYSQMQKYYNNLLTEDFVTSIKEGFSF